MKSWFANWAANALSVVISAFGAWGWLVNTGWPIGGEDVGLLAMAGVTFCAQQIANSAGAQAAVLLQRRLWLGAVLCFCLGLAFAAASAFSVGNAFDQVAAYRRGETLAPMVAAVAVEDQEISAAQAALQALPTDIPGSRLAILQAPLRARVEAARQRRGELEARARAASMATGADTPPRLVFEVLALLEPWVFVAGAFTGAKATSALSLSGDHSVEPKRRHGSTAERPNALTRTRRRGPFSAMATGLLIAFAPHADVRAATPNVGPLAAADAAPPPKPKARGSRPKSTTPVPRVSQREEPTWLTRAAALRATGQSYRAIARAINVPKSTVARWLTSGALD